MTLLTYWAPIALHFFVVLLCFILIIYYWLTDANKVVVLKDTYSIGYIKGALSALQTEIYFPFSKKLTV